MMKRFIAFVAATLLSAFAAPSFAADPYTTIDPPLTATSKGKIEVIEFFSYGCPHCNDFHPLVSAWAAKLPKDVSFRRVPVSFNRAPWARLARIYYALESTGDLAKLDVAVFKAIHEERKNFGSDEDVVKWATEKGLDGKKFTDALGAFSIQSKVQRGDQEAAAARIQGVPALVVDGRYLMKNEAAGSFEELLKLTDQTIAKARQDNKKRK